MPSADPALAAVEESMAATILRHVRVSTAIFSVAVVGETVEAVGAHTRAGRIFFSCAAVLFAVVLIRLFATVHGARRYVHAARTDSSQP